MTLISYGDIDKDAEKYIKEKFSTLDNALHFFPYNDKYVYDVTSLVGEHEFNKNFSDVYNSEKNSALPYSTLLRSLCFALNTRQEAPRD
jgi:hypothetical protein